MSFGEKRKVAGPDLEPLTPEEIVLRDSMKDKDVREVERWAYEMYRKRIVEEDTLINHRMMWMILSEPMFLGGYILTVVNLTKPEQWGLSVTIQILLIAFGLSIAFISAVSIKAGRTEIDCLAAEYEHRHGSAYKNKFILKLTGRTKSHWDGHALPRTLPPMLFILWLFMAACTVAFMLGRKIFS